MRAWIAERLRSLAARIDWRDVLDPRSYEQGYYDAQAEEQDAMRRSPQPTEQDVYEAWQAGRHGERW